MAAGHAADPRRPAQRGDLADRAPRVTRIYPEAAIRLDPVGQHGAVRAWARRSAKLPDNGAIHIERFVPVAEIDRLYWATPYYLVPDGDVACEPFAVIREAMRAEGKVALARYVKGGKERQLALEPRGRGVIAHELRTCDQVQAEADYFGRIPDRPVDDNMVAIAKQILQQHEGAFDPATFRDRYTEGLRALIAQKQAERGVTRSRGGPAADEAQVTDLMEALKRSLAGGGGAAAGERRKRSAAKVQPARTGKRKPASATG